MVEKEVIKSYALKNAVEHGGKAVQGSVLSSLFVEGLEKDRVKETMPLIQEILTEVNTLSIEEQKKQYEAIKDSLKKRDVRAEGELPELPNTENKKVVMRFAPFPSGPLHIGNTRQLILNDEYCKKYNGKLIFVMDDTIGSDNKPLINEAYDLIKNGVDWLNVKYDSKIIYKSDRIETYYDYAAELIRKGYMYVCSCPQEKFQKLKKERKECPCRNIDPEMQIVKWKKMFSKETKPGALVVRLKTSMQDPNPAFRDRVMFKISDKKHVKTKNKYRVYPSMEFSWAIDDHLLGMTHIIRGVELEMETKTEKFIWDIFRWPHPEVIHTGHLILEGVKISKSKGAEEVKSGKYNGWDDPRLWSLQSLRERGIQPEAIREFIKNMGITKSNSTVPVDVLYKINKKYLKKAQHFFFVENPIKILISGTPEIHAKIPLLRTNPKDFRSHKTSQEFLISLKDYTLLQNKNYRLMDLLNFKSIQNNPLDKKYFSFISQNDEQQKNYQKLVWVPESNKNAKVRIVMPDGKLKEGLGEKQLEKLKQWQVVYFENFGFCRVYKKNKDQLEFFFAHP